jgi:hypothetical protein
MPKLVRAAETADEEPEVEFDAFAEDEPVEEVDEKDVLVLTEKNFNDTVLEAPFALVRPPCPLPMRRGMNDRHAYASNSRYQRGAQVEFYAPWCGHCQVQPYPHGRAAVRVQCAAHGTLGVGCCPGQIL